MYAFDFLIAFSTLRKDGLRPLVLSHPAREITEGEQAAKIF
jgi:hypothetical protein